MRARPSLPAPKAEVRFEFLGTTGRAEHHTAESTTLGNAFKNKTRKQLKFTEIARWKPCMSLDVGWCFLAGPDGSRGCSFLQPASTEHSPHEFGIE